MSRESANQSGGEVARFFQILGRRKWVIIAVVLGTTLAAITTSILKAPVYSASAKVLISNTNIPAAVAGVANASPPEDPIRVAATEAQVLKLRPVMERARAAVGITDETVDQIRENVSISLGQDSNLLTVTATDKNSARAAQLADAVAREYVAYRTSLDTSKITSARADILAELAKLRASGTRSGTYYDGLLSSAQQLATIATVGASNYNVVEGAGLPKQISPRPVRDTIIAAVIGLILGIAVALLVDRLDRRIRTIPDVEEILGLSLLARVDAGGREGPGGRRMVASLDKPQSAAAESFRMLRANFEFTNTVASAQVVMLTSAQPREGKSTVAANLAATLAASGRKVALVDLDIRRPTIHAFFGIPQVPGATQVAAGTIDLREILADVELPSASDVMGAAGNAERDQDLEGRLLVAPAGVQPPNPGQFIASRAIARLIEELRTLADVVIVDAPPMLVCGDAKSLAPAIDAMLLVVRMSSATRPVLQEMRREIDATPATTLGFVVTGATAPVGYGYYVKRDGETPKVPAPHDQSSMPISA